MLVMHWILQLVGGERQGPLPDTLEQKRTLHHTLTDGPGTTANSVNGHKHEQKRPNPNPSSTETDN